jgi:hypothetical protein
MASIRNDSIHLLVIADEPYIHVVSIKKVRSTVGLLSPLPGSFTFESHTGLLGKVKETKICRGCSAIHRKVGFQRDVEGSRVPLLLMPL